jgi:ribosomal protein L22
MRFSLFKAPKPKGFNYKPLYYDPAKEELMQRVNAIKKEQEAEKQNADEEDLLVRKARMSKAFENRRSNIHLDNAQKQARQQRIRIMVIVSILAAIAYAYLR